MSKSILDIEIESKAKVSLIETFDSFHEINAAIKSTGSMFPKVIVEMIIGYDSYRFTRDLMAKLLHKLKPSSRERRELNSNENFLKEFGLLVDRKKDEFPIYNSFWWDLERLWFRIIIHLKQELIDASNDKFKEASKNVEFIHSIFIKKFSTNFPFSFDLEIVTYSSFSSELLKSEFFENANYLSRRFVDALKYVYSPLLAKGKKEMNGKKIKETTCNEFKMKFFNGNLDTDLLLKFFMIKYDIDEGLIRSCLLDNIEFDYLDFNEESIREIKDKISKSRNLEIIEYFTEMPTMIFVTKSIMNFIWLNGKRFEIEGSFFYISFFTE